MVDRPLRLNQQVRLRGKSPDPTVLSGSLVMRTSRTQPLNELVPTCKWAKKFIDAVNEVSNSVQHPVKSLYTPAGRGPRLISLSRGFVITEGSFWPLGATWGFSSLFQELAEGFVGSLS